MKRETAKLFLDNFTDEQLDDAGFITDREVMQHYVDGGEVNFYGGHDSEIYIYDSDPSFRKNYKWRKAELPEIEFMGVKVRIKPPMTEAPEKLTLYWFFDSSYSPPMACAVWSGCSVDINRLKCGQCLWSEEDAKTVVKALGWETEK